MKTMRILVCLTAIGLVGCQATVPVERAPRPAAVARPEVLGTRAPQWSRVSSVGPGWLRACTAIAELRDEMSAAWKDCNPPEAEGQGPAIAQQ